MASIAVKSIETSVGVELATDCVVGVVPKLSDRRIGCYSIGGTVAALLIVD